MRFLKFFGKRLKIAVGMESFMSLKSLIYQDVSITASPLNLKRSHILIFQAKSKYFLYRKKCTYIFFDIEAKYFSKLLPVTYAVNVKYRIITLDFAKNQLLADLARLKCIEVVNSDKNMTVRLNGFYHQFIWVPRTPIAAALTR